MSRTALVGVELGYTKGFHSSTIDPAGDGTEYEYGARYSDPHIGVELQTGCETRARLPPSAAGGEDVP